jgi:predicted transcriptional regulator
MKINEVSQVLDARIFSGRHLSREIDTIYVSDLMSDVLTYGREAQLLVTSLTNQQTIRTVEMVEIPAICYTNGKNPGEETLELANNKKITVLVTELTTFQVTGKLYAAGLKG